MTMWEPEDEAEWRRKQGLKRPSESNSECSAATESEERRLLLEASNALGRILTGGHSKSDSLRIIREIRALLAVNLAEHTGCAEKHGKSFEAVQDAAFKFRDSLVEKADEMRHGAYPLWHGWALFDAFVAGAAFAQSASGAQYRSALEQIDKIVYEDAEKRARPSIKAMEAIQKVLRAALERTTRSKEP